jgi:hypothetical protein
VAAGLSDQAWADICAAAGRAPDAEARGVLSAILFEEYPAFHYDRERVAAAYRRSERMLKHLDAFAAEYCAEFAAVDEGARADAVTNTVRITPDLWAIEGLRKQALGLWLYARAIRRANARRASVQREWLYHRLCTVWLDHFHAHDLSYSRPPKGGDPYGPLITFMLAAMRQIMSKRTLPAPETVADAIDRERAERQNAQRLARRLRHGGLPRQK